ncbi:hypothetical protein [Vreelandella venusta]|uniref:Uncharacterized protein n=1 Tax=Vreelandella venusta TaxID=44935 RepID=A0AAP9ZB21_9GAMM|nr:hypothetical protein [Halomonas venusta]QRL02054.1 hypothetical protein JDS37_12075 [Halomonas venusta]GEK50636.1 hypothetical protein HVE01_13570 [Halomonas venusta]
MNNFSRVFAVFDLKDLRGTLGNAYHELAVAKSTVRFGDLRLSRRSSATSIAGAFFVPVKLCYGGLRGETFGSAGSLDSRFANPAQSAPILFGDSRGGSEEISRSLPMANHSQGASTHTHVSPSHVAIALIGAKLIAYRVNRKPAQLHQLLGMARMATALNLLSYQEHDQLLVELERLCAEEVAHD